MVDMTMNRAAFYAYLRRRDSGIFGTSLSQRQVTAIDAILDAGVHLPIDHLANVLAQVYRETGGGMYPIKETVMPWHKDKNPSDATVIARLDSAFAKGQLSWVSQPYWRSGWFGRGGIQITHRDNYAKLSKYVGADLVKSPDRTLDPVISARIAVKGMELGLFTGKRLSNFDGTKYDHNTARSIVNGDRNKRDKGETKTVGQLVEGYALGFTKALRAAGYTETAQKTPATAPQPVSTGKSPQGGLWALLARILGGKA